MMCEERAGFLFARACDQMSVWGCQRCTKPICAAHTRTTSQGQACIACARQIMAEEEQQQQQQQQQDPQQNPQATQDAGASGRYTDSSYHDTDDPYFYRSRSSSSGRHEHYDADDRRAFDSSANEEPEGSWEQDPGGS
jgi:hypothetical protein